MISPQLSQILTFLMELDQLKTVLRQTKPTGSDRPEDSAQHSWHLAIAALTLHTYSNHKLDLHKCIKMLLLHDIVEIDAGDTYCYTPTPETHKKETQASQRIFGLLPTPLKEEFISLWEEFEANTTPEAKFAQAIDTLIPFLQNHTQNGKFWQERNITADMIIQRQAPLLEVAPELGEAITHLIADAVKQGILKGKE